MSTESAGERVDRTKCILFRDSWGTAVVAKAHEKYTRVPRRNGDWCQCSVWWWKELIAPAWNKDEIRRNIFNTKRFHDGFLTHKRYGNSTGYSKKKNKKHLPCLRIIWMRFVELITTTDWLEKRTFIRSPFIPASTSAEKTDRKKQTLKTKKDIAQTRTYRYKYIKTLSKTMCRTTSVHDENAVWTFW